MAPVLVRALVAAVVAASAACAHPGATTAPDEPLSPSRRWLSPLHQRHPLVGRIWSVREARWLGEAALQAAIADADFVLLGEVHDNPDHHLLQARFIRALARDGRQPAIAVEMVQTSRQPALNAALVGKPKPEDIAEAVEWGRTRWPPFTLYRPLFAATIDAGLPLLAADLPRKQVDEYFRAGDTAFAPRVQQLLARAGWLDDESARAMGDEMRAVHCGHLTGDALKQTVLLQQARHAQLAERLLSADRELASPGYEQGAVLIADLAHVRTDRAVPTFLAREAPGHSIAAVGLLEVNPERETPQAYASAFGSPRLPFDYVVFTPAAQRAPPCEGIPPPAPPRRLPTITASLQ